MPPGPPRDGPVEGRIRTPSLAGRLLLAVAAGAVAMVIGLAVVALSRDGASAPRYVSADDPETPAVLRRPDPELGYSLAPDARVRARRVSGDTTLYDVVYTTDAAGLRVTPGNRSTPAIVFFGCSFVFGEGLADDETLPALVSEALGHGRDVVNAGAPGYGPHQMLRALETGRLDDRLRTGASHVIYEAISSHGARAAGRTTWDLSGPRYELDGDSVRFTGPLHGWLTALGLRAIGKLVSLGALPPGLQQIGAATPEDRERWVRIVERSAWLVREQWGAAFVVLLWDDDAETAALATELERRGIAVLPVSGILPRADREEQMIAVDGHPAAPANRALASAVRTWIETSGPAPR